jgi:Zn-dependent protease with chaperone function/uncharacterized membrane-anchored protein YhcB (DUF1043 family)
MKIFKNISPRAYEHPTDRAALITLSKTRGFDRVLRKVIGSLGDKRMRLMFLANAVRVNSEQLPNLHSTLIEVSACLDLEEVPELFVSQSPNVNAMAIGIDKPFIVINSSLINLLNEDELRCVIAHEAGHILSGHSLYKTVLITLLGLGSWLFPLRVVLLPILLGLKEWDRKSELSSDRAALLVTQNLGTVQNVIIRLAGGSGQEAYNLEEFENQAKEYEEAGNITDSIFKVLNLFWLTHPFPVQRLLEIKRWSMSEQYKDILAGNYPKRDSEDETRVTEEIKNLAENYKSDMDKLRDTAGKLFDDLAKAGGDIFEDVAKSGEDLFSRLSATFESFESELNKSKKPSSDKAQATDEKPDTDEK